jgi:uncharacterized membrane protein
MTAVRDRQRHEWSRSARTRVALAGGIGAVVGAAVALAARAPWAVSLLVGWCAAAVVYLLQVWPVILRANAAATKDLAVAEDDSRAAADLALVSASVASLAGVAFVLIKAGNEEGRTALLMTALAVFSVVVAWACVHTVFTLRYACVYWTSPRGGVDFNDDDDPDYHDFAYLAFTVGMTYQVSDTDLTTKDMRRAALRHAILSYVFGTAIIAMTINIVAGIAS